MRTTYGSNVDAGGEVRRSSYLGAVQAIQNLAHVGRQGGEDLGATAAHAHETDRRLRIRLDLGREDEVDGVLLRFEP